jgi:hypothetical protein
LEGVKDGEGSEDRSSDCRQKLPEGMDSKFLATSSPAPPSSGKCSLLLGYTRQERYEQKPTEPSNNDLCTGPPTSEDALSGCCVSVVPGGRGTVVCDVCQFSP